MTVSHYNTTSHSIQVFCKHTPHHIKNRLFSALLCLTQLHTSKTSMIEASCSCLSFHRTDIEPRLCETEQLTM